MFDAFFYEYFCKPIMDPTVQGYNIVNTATYAAILFIVVWFGIIPMLKKQQIPLGFKFMLALFPYVLAGAAFRTFTDSGFFQKTCSPLEFGFYTFTPGIWIATGAIAIAALLIARKVSKGDENMFAAIFGGIGLMLAIPIVGTVAMRFVALDGALIVIAGVAILTALACFIAQKFKKDFFKDKLNITVVAGQALDGFSTLVATSYYNCGEQHPLSGAILGVNPALFVLVKLILAVLIVHYLDKDIEDKKTVAFIKIAVTILGFATGGRNFFTLSVGTCL